MNATDNTAPRPLSITVVNGNLRFIRQPLLLGHYRSMVLTGTESIMDELLGGVMGQSLALRNYPDEPGTNQVFLNTRIKNPLLKFPRPEAVIVVGLGDEGKLKADNLAETVRRGVIEWARRRHERERDGRRHFELAATLMASGGSGISPGQSACLVAKGIYDANQELASATLSPVEDLYLIELYLDRASEAWRALRAQAAVTPGEFVLADTVQTGVGALRRPLDAGYRGTGYDLITAMTAQDEQGDSAISYTIDTKRARTELHTQPVQFPVLKDLVTAGATGDQSDTRIGRTLFRELVPADVERYLAGTTDVVLEVDGGTAGIPWEMLDTPDTGKGPASSEPWAIRTKLIRKLRTADFSTSAKDAAGDDAVLVIGEPAIDEKKYRPLPGARAEAAAVATCLKEAGLDPANVRDLLGARGREVITSLSLRNWRIVHIAGHGEPPQSRGPRKKSKTGVRPRASTPGGVVLSNGMFFGAREIKKMRVAPDLVFVNCCYLAERDASQLLADGGYGLERAAFAATVAESLINIGVRCVIAAGWDIEDSVANTFATTFYAALVGQKARFIEAVAAARQAALKQGGNTWAAYQCYGDPDWRFEVQQASAPQNPGLREEVVENIASPAALVLTLETLAVNSQFDDDERAVLPKTLERLEARFGKQWGSAGDVAEAFAVAWAKSDVNRAIKWYEYAVAANDGKASIRAIEQLNNLRIRVAWEAVMPPQADWPRDAAFADARGETLHAARARIKSALDVLERLTDGVQSSIERQSLCGSGWKRMAMVESLAGDERAERDAILAMKQRYATAEAAARDSGDRGVFYPALNCMAAELILDAETPDWPRFDLTRVQAVRASLEAKNDDDPDFWSVGGVADLEVYEAIARNDLAGARASIETLYADLHGRVPAPWHWASVRDQLRLVLSKYSTRAATEDRAAGEALLSSIEGFARPT